jgi:probable O-glycosylation ligase (exosortase A-associated)
MVAATLIGTFGVYIVSPFCGVFVYYLFAVLRPQFMWDWAFRDLLPGVNWSLYVALATIGGAALGMLGIIVVDSRPTNLQRPHRFHWAHYALFGFAVWILITYVTAKNPEVSERYVVDYVKVFLMYGVSAYLIRSVWHVWSLYVMAALALAYIAYEVNYQYFVNDYLGIYHNGYGGLDNNGAGLMLAMGMPLCWFGYEGTNRWWRWGFLALIPPIIHAVLMTYSRGAMVSLLIACPWVLFRSRQKVRMGIAMVVFAIFALPILAGPQIRERFFSIEEHDVDESANQRKTTWNAAWNIAKENPILGVGPRNASELSFEYGAAFQGQTIHSTFLQIAADNGFVGLALYLSLFATAWYCLYRCRRLVGKSRDHESQRIAACASGIESSMFLYAVGSAFLSLETFELPYLLLLLAAQLAVVTGALEEGQSRFGPVVGGPLEEWQHRFGQPAASENVRGAADGSVLGHVPGMPGVS